jgi:hypothetical protein
MSLMDRGELELREAAEALDLSERQVRRIRAAYRDCGAGGWCMEVGDASRQSG